MKVLFLGAGGSVPSGYPSGASLMATLEEEMSNCADVILKEDWKRFEEYRRNADGLVGFVLKHPNPELALSLLDLFVATLDEDSFDAYQKLNAALRVGNKEASTFLTQQMNSEVRNELAKGRMAVHGFAKCLDFLFGRYNYNDANSERRVLRKAIGRELERLQTGDVVITTNWDTTVERSLLEQNRWTPENGYGFSLELTCKSSEGDNGYPDWVPRTSMITVLKLHGSYGWSYTSDLDIYLRSGGFLDTLPFRMDDKVAFLKDTREPVLPDLGEKPALQYPSYLKKLEGEAMQATWSKAAQALNKADKVLAIGASLPDADLGVRALLSVLRLRATTGDVSVEVWNPNSRARERWGELLGANDNVKLLNRRLE